jgi:predicted nucleic acid-binding protein
MRIADASVAVAAFASWHPDHQAARSALGDDARIVAHAALETYSVLTRLPERFRAAPDAVWPFLQRRFPDEFVSLSPSALRSALESLAQLGVVGGAVYDALIAVTARDHDAVLLSLDRRAAPTYERVGATVELLGDSGSGD